MIARHKAYLENAAHAINANGNTQHAYTPQIIPNEQQCEMGCLSAICHLPYSTRRGDSLSLLEHAASASTAVYRVTPAPMYDDRHHPGLPTAPAPRTFSLYHIALFFSCCVSRTTITLLPFILQGSKTPRGRRLMTRIFLLSRYNPIRATCASRVSLPLHDVLYQKHQMIAHVVHNLLRTGPHAHQPATMLSRFPHVYSASEAPSCRSLSYIRSSCGVDEETTKGGWLTLMMISTAE